jgi:hypothetical protein
MASGYTTQSTITELIPEITEACAFIYQDAAIGRGLVKVKDVSSVPGLTVEFPRWTEVAGDTAFSNDYDSPTSHAMDTSGMATLTLARRSVFVLLPDTVKKAINGYDVAGIGKAMAMAQAKQDDTAIFNILTGTTNWTTGTGVTNAAFSLSYLADGILLLEANEVSYPLICVLHHQQYDNIRTELTPIISTSGIAVPQAGEMLRRGFVGELLGAQMFKTNRISSGTVASTGDNYNGLLFPLGDGIGYGYSSLEVTGVEFERNAEAASTKMIINYMDSAAVIYGSAVCKLYSST